MNRIFTFETQDELTFVVPALPKIERAVRICGEGITLRRLDPLEEHYDPAGRGFESVVTLPNHKANALKELTGFRADEFTTGSFGGSIGYQLSNDGGATWLTFDTALPGWVPAVGLFATVYVSQAVVEKNAGTFPLLPVKQFRIRVQLKPNASGSKRPLLKNAVVFLEYDYDFEVDLARSLKHHLEALVRVRMTWCDQLSAASTIAVDSGLTVGGPVKVYNLTTDPDRTTDLFVSVALDGKTVTFSPAQTGQIEVSYFGIPKVFIAAEENYQFGSIPAVLINVPTITTRRDLDTLIKEYDTNRETFVSRSRPRRTLFDAAVVIGCQAQLKHMALALADAVERAIDPHRSVLSEAIGETYAVLSVGPKAQLDQVVRSLFVTNVPVTLGGKAWLRPEFVEVDVAREVITTVRPADPEQIGGSAGLGFSETTTVGG